MTSPYKVKTLGFAIGTLLFSSLATTEALAADNLATSPYLFGDWNGTRTDLADKGITFDFGYGSEAAHNFTGGKAQLTRYTDQWKLGTTVDLDKVWGWKGATFKLNVTDRNGRDLGSDAQIGNNQLLQEVYGRGQTWHLTEFSLQQNLFNNRVSIKAGRLLAGNEFATFTCDFQNLTFCGAQPGNIVGSYWINWPTSVWAADVKFATTANTYLKVGAFQVNPNYPDDAYARTKGLDFDFPGGTTGALLPLEFGWTPSVNGLPGTYKVGGWYNTSVSKDLFLDVNRQPLAITQGDALGHDGAYGGYIAFMQQVTGEAGGQGASVFLNISQADRNTAATNGQYAFGVEQKGVFGRPGDMVGLAIGGSHANGRYGDYQRLYNSLHPADATPVNDGYEYVTEAFYSWSPIPSVSFRPNLQYILHPGGDSDNHNAFVLGLKTAIAF